MTLQRPSLSIALALPALTAALALGPGAGRAYGAPPAAAPGCAAQTRAFEGEGGQILEAIPNPPAPDIPNSNAYSVAVSGMGDSLYGVTLTTDVEAAHSGDLRITLTPPSGAGPAVTVRANSVNEKGEAAGPTEGANVFNGTLWEDSAPQVAAKTIFTNDVTAGPLEPDAAFARLDGIDPNGTWLLTIEDYQANDGGKDSLGGWSLDVSTCQSAPTSSASGGSNAATVQIPHPGSASSSIVVSSAPCYLESATVSTSLHDNSARAVAMALTSPQGETVALTRANGPVDAAEVFAGTVWEDAAPVRVTSATLAGGKTSSPLEPEQGLARLIGENPNGTWTLTVTDGAEDTATLEGWSLNLTGTGVCPAPSPSPTPSGPSSAGPAGAGSPASTASASTSTAAVAATITRLTLTPASFRAQSGHGRHDKRSGGSRISFTLSAAATVRLAFEALGPGLRSGSRCLVRAPHRHGRSCTLVRSVPGGLTVAAHVGANTLVFAGDLQGRALAAGRYRLLASIAGSPRAEPAEATFSML